VTNRLNIRDLLAKGRNPWNETAIHPLWKNFRSSGLTELYFSASHSLCVQPFGGKEEEFEVGTGNILPRTVTSHGTVNLLNVK
jgi:hypothetical protein